MDFLEKFCAELVTESQNTLGADVNEILTGFYLAGGNWNNFSESKIVLDQLAKRKKQISKDEYNNQDARAKSMAIAALDWAKQNGYKGKVAQVYWTARPGVLQKAVGVDVESKKNPTDVLIKFTDGKFLGISAKSTTRNADIGFKNPGIGALKDKIGLDIQALIKNMESEYVKKYKLPFPQDERKAYIRDNDRIQKKTTVAGVIILTHLRDLFYDTLSKMSQKDLRKYVISSWLDVEDIFPYYIKVTGHGTGDKFHATIIDPQNNTKLKKLTTGNLEVEKIGNTSVGLTANGARILKMRFKYSSERLASSIKMSGDPWGSND